MPKLEVEPRIHTIYVYFVDGKAKPSSDELYVKKGEKIQWVSTTALADEFEISFDKPEGSPFPNPPYKERTGVGAKPIIKLGTFNYSIKHMETGIITDPTIDVGDPPK